MQILASLIYRPPQKKKERNKMKPIAQQFVDDISAIIDKYRDEGITISEAIGGLEIVKLDLWNEAADNAEDGF